MIKNPMELFCYRSVGLLHALKQQPELLNVFFNSLVFDKTLCTIFLNKYSEYIENLLIINFAYTIEDIEQIRQCRYFNSTIELGELNGILQVLFEIRSHVRLMEACKLVGASELDISLEFNLNSIFGNLSTFIFFISHTFTRYLQAYPLYLPYYNTLKINYIL